MQAVAGRFPPPQSAQEIEFLFDVARSIPYFSQMTNGEQDEVVRKLLTYECYIQAVTLLQWRIENGGLGELQKLDDYLAILSIWHDGCEDFQKFVETLKECIVRTRPSFSTIRMRLVENIVGAEQFAEQAKIYRQVCSSVEDPSDRVLMLERLAFLYEKKLTLNSEVESTYAELLALDPSNIKALRHFKVIQIQSGLWKDAIKTLEQLTLSHPQGSFERQRAAFELAQIYLYQLNQPQKSRETLVTHCTDSRIDISQTFAEALERMNAFDELLGFLVTRESKTNNADERSRIKHKLGLISIKSGKTREALTHFQESVSLNPQNLMAHESLIASLADGKMNAELLAEIKTLSKNIKLETSQQSVAAMLERATQLISPKGA